MDYIHFIEDVVRETILIAALVINMMLLIEFINVKSRGLLLRKLSNNSFGQVALSAALGLIPGCMGGFAVVSLFTHRLIGLGALVAMMICSSGDEAFFMMALIPETYMIMLPILFVLAICVGYLVDKFSKRQKQSTCSHFTQGDNFAIHQEDNISLPSIWKVSSYRAALKPTRYRIIISIGLLLFIGAMSLGLLEHHHHAIEGVDAHHHHHHHSIFSERWLNVAFIGVSIFTLMFTLTASEHFIKEHLWDHVIRKHLLPIVAWTLAALVLVNLFINNLDMRTLLEDNLWIMLLVAVLIGIIPESGPHLFFVTMFASGVLPLSVLLANSIVQDGHTAIPLLADSRVNFLKAKIINMFVGFGVGAVMMMMGF